MTPFKKNKTSYKNHIYHYNKSTLFKSCILYTIHQYNSIANKVINYKANANAIEQIEDLNDF